LRITAKMDKRNHKHPQRCEDAGAMNKEHRIAWVARCEPPDRAYFARNGELKPFGVFKGV